jgi:anti-sigma factor ChrR (cupin superfamily)
MSDACREWRGEIAALAIGRLTPDERARVVAHADSCAECRSELAELEQLSRAMTHADASRLDHEPAPPPELRERILTQLRAERADARRATRRHTRRVLAAAAAILVILAGIGVAVQQSAGDGDRIAFEIAVDDSRGDFELHRSATGTSISFRHEGLHDGAVYWLWLTDASGKRVGAGTFLGTRGEATMTKQAALAIDQVVRVWVTDEDDVIVLDKQL